MCRVISYIGEPLMMDELIYKPSNSLVEQAYNPKFMFHYKNFSGSGFVAWHRQKQVSDRPVLYKTKNLPFYDSNLRRLAKTIQADSAIAHVRGGSLTDSVVVIDSNAHPFMFKDAPIALAHNGSLRGLNKIKAELCALIHPHWLVSMRGTTDTEWIYALLLTHLCESGKNAYTAKEVVDATMHTFESIGKLRAAKNIHMASPVNLFISHGQATIIARFVYDFGNYTTSLRESHLQYHTLWYTYGERYAEHDGEYRMIPGTPRSMLCASEPITLDTTGWVEVPEYAIMSVERQEDDSLKLAIEDIAIG